nr:MAG TPA: putative membrane protein [Caudoviricetes sp.]
MNDTILKIQHCPGAANTRAFQNAISKYNRKYLFEVKDSFPLCSRCT